MQRVPSAHIGSCRVDLLVGDELVVELATWALWTGANVSTDLTYLRAGGFQLGLLINFNGAILRDGIRRVISSG